MKNYKKFAESIISSYAGIFFVDRYFVGFLLLILSFINPNIGISGLLCVISSYIFAKFLGMHEQFLSSGFYTYNPLLVGLSIGYLLKFNLLTLFLVSISGIITFLLTFSLVSVLYQYLKLPVLSLPFVVVSCIVYLASSQYSNLFVNGFYPQTPIFEWVNKLPLWFVGLTRALGAIVFLPNVISGFIILLAIFFVSRILFFLAVTGYFTGTLTIAAFTGSFVQAFSNVNSFNFILIAMALGGVFLIPNVKSYSISIIAVVSSSIFLYAIEKIWYQYGVPVFTLPFNIASMMFLYVLGLLNFPLITKFYRGTPEKTLDHYLTYNSRFPGTYRTLSLPFSGEWTVWQGINGKWTHKGAWMYAIDFVITDENGKTYSGDEKIIDNYYCFRKPILSPARGRVVKIINDIEDNPIGTVNKDNNWGNLILIYDERGFYVLICHLLKGSIRVKEGDWVERGRILALCGNSGYSPQPHIHIHVQLTNNIGAPTVPFSFIQYIDSNNRYHSNDIPKENQRLAPLFTDKVMDFKMSFLLDEQMEFELKKGGTKVKNVKLSVKMDSSGEFYLESGNSRLYFTKWEGTFYVNRIEGKVEPELKAIFLALPRLPLVCKHGMEWNDCIPTHLALKGIRKDITLLKNYLYPSNCTVRGTYRFTSDDEITGYIEPCNIKTHTILHETKGFSKIEVALNETKITLRRCENG